MRRLSLIILKLAYQSHPQGQLGDWLRTPLQFSVRNRIQLWHDTQLLVPHFWEMLKIYRTFGRHYQQLEKGLALQVWTLESLSSCPSSVTWRLYNLRQVTTHLWLRSYLGAMKAEIWILNDFQSLIQLQKLNLYKFLSELDFPKRRSGSSLIKACEYDKSGHIKG